jgi:hypothetical protein
MRCGAVRCESMMLEGDALEECVDESIAKMRLQFFF